MKSYILQEKVFVNGLNDYYWFDIIDSDDLLVIHQYYDVFDKKYYDRVYRVVEVIK